MSRYHQMADLAPRDIVARAIDNPYIDRWLRAWQRSYCGS
jgi:aspartate oxidase